jgi:hypothetical protein
MSLFGLIDSFTNEIPVIPIFALLFGCVVLHFDGDANHCNIMYSFSLAASRQEKTMHGLSNWIPDTALLRVLRTGGVFWLRETDPLSALLDKPNR